MSETPSTTQGPAERLIAAARALGLHRRTLQRKLAKRPGTGIPVVEGTPLR